MDLEASPRFDLTTVPAAGQAADTVRDLFLEYGESLGFNTCFGGFEQELDTLPGDYAPPRGCLLLARDGGEAVGCVGVKPLDASRCEMKRLFVRPRFRRSGAGRALAAAAIDWARGAGYRTMYLDSLPAMIEARALYRSLGFVPCPPYYDNSCLGSDCFELHLGDP